MLLNKKGERGNTMLDRRAVIEKQIRILEEVNDSLSDDKEYFPELVEEITKVSTTIAELVETYYNYA